MFIQKCVCVCVVKKTNAVNNPHQTQNFPLERYLLTSACATLFIEMPPSALQPYLSLVRMYRKKHTLHF